MQYNVTCMLGEKVRQALMNQRQLDECRSRSEMDTESAVSLGPH